MSGRCTFHALVDLDIPDGGVHRVRERCPEITDYRIVGPEGHLGVYCCPHHGFKVQDERDDTSEEARLARLFGRAWPEIRNRALTDIHLHMAIEVVRVIDLDHRRLEQKLAALEEQHRPPA